MREQLKTLIDTALKQYFAENNLETSALDTFTYEMEVPKKASFGDLSVNAAMKLSKIAKAPPAKIAEALKKICEELLLEEAIKVFIEKVEVAKPGFLNFYLTQEVLVPILEKIQQEGKQFGTNQSGVGEKVLLEFVSANPTGPLTIAHGRQACVGDSLAAIMETCGYEVTSEFYLNDGGKQIETLGLSVYTRYLECCGQSVSFPEDGYQGSYITDIAKEIHTDKGEEYLQVEKEEVISFFAKYAADKILNEIKEDLKAISVTFKNYYSEATLYEGKVQDVLDTFKKKKLSYEKEGALWFESTKFTDDKDRVLVKSDGSYTYLVPDIAYHRDKFERGYTRLINLLGPDHHGYIARLKASVEGLGYDPETLRVLIIQLTTLYKKGEPVRMSTRKGTFVSLRELIDEVGADATRLFFLMKLTDSHLDFDLELAKEKSQDNPVYYFQYAYVRISSILRLSRMKEIDDADVSLLTQNEEHALVKRMADYPYILMAASKQCEPYRLVDYLHDLAALFHRFYNAHRVNSDDIPLTKARLYLVRSVQTVIGNGLSLLGVSLPERM